ncbi:unnamed protein product [Periconia digitata]|uniref:Uncharacterized protein n=1 Tax=Periconia digitata TaxID=1303443 RepID=A0A9W4U174_9PLEO|nr:unnamed protein product [Periconia digitata]
MVFKKKRPVHISHTGKSEKVSQSGQNCTDCTEPFRRLGVCAGMPKRVRTTTIGVNWMILGTWVTKSTYCATALSRRRILRDRRGER